MRIWIGPSPGSDNVGREGIAPDRLLRCAVLKHIKGWSYRNSTGNSEPAFCIDASRAFMRTRFQILAIRVGLLRSLVRKALSRSTSGSCNKAKEAVIIAGKKLRTDTTAVETLFALLQSGDSRGLEEAQKNIDDHIKKQCDAKGADFWDYPWRTTW